MNLPRGSLVDQCPKCGEWIASRTEDQNSAQWPILNAWAAQREWPVNGVMCKLTPEEFKDILTAAFEGDTNPRIASGLNGGVVMLGRRTRRYGKKRFAEWLDWLNAASYHAGIKVPLPKNRCTDGTASSNA